MGTQRRLADAFDLGNHRFAIEILQIDLQTRLSTADVRWFSKDKSAYRYLSDSAAAFPYGQAFNNILAQIGFIVHQHKPQTFGVATIYRATK